MTNRSTNRIRSSRMTRYRSLMQWIDSEHGILVYRINGAANRDKDGTIGLSELDSTNTPCDQEQSEKKRKNKTKLKKTTLNRSWESISSVEVFHQVRY